MAEEAEAETGVKRDDGRRGGTVSDVVATCEGVSATASVGGELDVRMSGSNGVELEDSFSVSVDASATVDEAASMSTE